jgi:hypothetical protein
MSDTTIAAGVENIVYRILRDMMIEEELDYETYKRFTKRLETELGKAGWKN